MAAGALGLPPVSPGNAELVEAPIPSGLVAPVFANPGVAPDENSEVYPGCYPIVATALENDYKGLLPAGGGAGADPA